MSRTTSGSTCLLWILFAVGAERLTAGFIVVVHVSLPRE